jgi:hypothetical protein
MYLLPYDTQGRANLAAAERSILYTRLDDMAFGFRPSPFPSLFREGRRNPILPSLNREGLGVGLILHPLYIVILTLVKRIDDCH